MNAPEQRSQNPLLDFSGLPRFAEIKPGHVTAAVDELLAAGRATIEAVKRAGPTWDEFVAPLEAKCSENLLDATNAFSISVDKTRIAGIPDDVLMAAKEAAEKDGEEAARGKWKFTLHAPSYLPVMQYADDRKLRETLYREST